MSKGLLCARSAVIAEAIALAAFACSFSCQGIAAQASEGAQIVRERGRQCDASYAGLCDPRDPCSRHDSKSLRYGGQRDFECFIFDEN